MEEKVEVMVTAVALEDGEVASTQDKEEEEEVAVNKVLNIMENVSIAEDKDISSSNVDFLSKKKVKVVF